MMITTCTLCPRTYDAVGDDADAPDRRCPSCECRLLRAALHAAELDAAALREALATQLAEAQQKAETVEARARIVEAAMIDNDKRRDEYRERTERAEKAASEQRARADAAEVEGADVFRILGEVCNEVDRVGVADLSRVGLARWVAENFRYVLSDAAEQRGNARSWREGAEDHRRERDEARAALATSEAAAAAMRGALGMAEPWPAVDVLRRLADAVEHLGAEHNCDRHGWEQDREAGRRAVAIADALGAALQGDAGAPLLTEVERLRGCMRQAGLAALMRSGTPEDVAAHLADVRQSYAGVEAALERAEGRVRALTEAAWEVVVEAHVVEAYGYAPRTLLTKRIPALAAVLDAPPSEPPDVSDFVFSARTEWLERPISDVTEALDRMAREVRGERPDLRGAAARLEKSARTIRAAYEERGETLDLPEEKAAGGGEETER